MLLSSPTAQGMLSVISPLLHRLKSLGKLWRGKEIYFFLNGREFW